MLNPRQIEAFRAIIETGTVGRAADRMCLSQPAVSKLIRNLEHAAGLALFDRRPGRLLPTSEALLLYDEANRVYEGMSRLETFVADLKYGQGAALTVGVMPALSGGFAQDLLLDHRKRHPSTRVSLHALSTDRMVGMVWSGAMDLALTSHPVDHPEVELIALTDFDYACVMPPGHPLSVREEIVPGDLADQPFLSFSKGSDQREAIDRILAEAGVRPSVAMEASMATSICAMIARGFGVSIMAPIYLGALEGLVEIRPFRPRITSRLHLVVPRYRPRSRQAGLFIDTALAFCRRDGR